MILYLLQLGTLDYATATDLQKHLVQLRQQERIGNTLLLVEHSPVITLGRNARVDNVLASPELLAQKGVELHECDRGGDVTFHGPGQLVAYPIFDLRSFQPRLGAVQYVRLLEEVVLRSCGDSGIPCERIAGLTGVWTQNDPPAKICAIGVHISRGVTSHGLALNVATDLDYFQLIVPCGIEARPVTSMERELGPEKTPSIAAVADLVSRNFGRVFEAQVLWLESLDQLMTTGVGQPLREPEELRRLRGDEPDELFLA